MRELGELGEMGKLGKLGVNSKLYLTLFPVLCSLTNDEGQMTKDK